VIWLVCGLGFPHAIDELHSSLDIYKQFRDVKFAQSALGHNQLFQIMRVTLSIPRTASADRSLWSDRGYHRLSISAIYIPFEGSSRRIANW